MSYEIKNGKIQAKACELNVVHHCNLSCRACSHLSPMAKKFFVDPEKVLNDLSLLSKYYHPQRISLIGGEALLHPDLLDVVNAVRQSGISECIRVVTNGLLLWKMPKLFWQSVDQVHISLYPSHRISVEQLKLFQQQAREHGVALELRYIDYFREPYAELGTEDIHLIHRIYSTCQIAHIWDCHTVCEGYFYKCPPSVFIPRFLQGKSGTNDGLKLANSETFGNDLLSFLLAKDPLESCRYCLGTVGKQLPHMEVSSRISPTPRPTEDLVDWKYLEKLEVDGLYPSPWIQVASMLNQRVLASMPPAIRLHPLVSRVITTVRSIHTAMQ